MIRRINGWLCVALGLVTIGVCRAGDPMPVGSTVITSKTLNFDYKLMVAEFQGNVVVVDPEMRMEADRLNVVFEGTNQVKTVTATGNVRIHQAEKEATADRAHFVARTGEIALNGNASLNRGDDLVMGDSITFWTNDERMTCTPARLVISPQERAGGAAKSGGSLLGRQIRSTTPAPSTRP